MGCLQQLVGLWQRNNRRIKRMKTQHKLLTYLAITCITILSCTKNHSAPMTDRRIDPLPPYLVARDYFWGEPWQKPPTGYEIKLQSKHLTDSAIRKGIRVGVAIFSDGSNFETLPFTINDPSYFRDTINLTYSALPGQLQVFAKTTVTITWPSDIFIQYE